MMMHLERDLRGSRVRPCTGHGLVYGCAPRLRVVHRNIYVSDRGRTGEYAAINTCQAPTERVGVVVKGEGEGGLKNHTLDMDL